MRHRRSPLPRGEGGERSEPGGNHGFTFQTARQPPSLASELRRAKDKRQRSGKSLGSRPPSVLSASKRSRRVKRHKALVRNAAPVAALRSGLSLHRKGRPALDAGRRALRRFTVEIFAGPGPPRLGPRLRAGENGPPVVQLAPSFRVVVPERRGPRRPESPVDETERPPARSRASSTRYGLHSPLQQTVSPVDALERAGMRA